MSVDRVSAEGVEERIQKADQPVVLDFWMDNCPPCQALTPTLHSVADAYEGRVQVFQVKVDEQSSLLKKYHIKGMPTLLLFKDGVQIHQMSGLIRRGELEAAFEDLTRNIP